MKMKMNASLLAAAAFAVSGMSAVRAATFTAGDLVVYRVGDGSATLTSASTAVFLDDYSASGTLVNSVALPTAASGSNNPLTASGTATSEGGLTLSANGQLLIVTGYATGTGTSGVAGTATTAVPRVIGEVDGNGNINTTTTTTAFSANNPRSAVSDNGTNIWIAGANTGVVYTTLGASGAGTVVSNTVTNLRDLEISGGQLYVSTGSGSAVRIGTVGTGLPTTTGNTTTNLPGLPIVTNDTAGVIAGPYAYAFATLNGGSTPDTLYVADNGNGPVATAGTIDKFSLVSGSWTLTGTVAEFGLTGLLAEPTANGEQLFVSTPTTLFSLTDTSGFDGTLSGTPTAIATAGTNEAFRGLAFAPTVAAAPEPASLSVVALGGAATLARRRKQAR
jgi:hypothetical protein